MFFDVELVCTFQKNRLGSCQTQKNIKIYFIKIVIEFKLLYRLLLKLLPNIVSDYSIFMLLFISHFCFMDFRILSRFTIGTIEKKLCSNILFI